MRVYCVAGMHRSGTSLVARVLNLLGLYLGPDDDLIPPLPDNPKGFWESKSIVSINDRILNHFGGTWRQPPELLAGWEDLPNLSELAEEAGDLLGRFVGSSDAFGWKDPRSSLTFPFWRNLIDINREIVPIRHPIGVAASLAARNGIDSEVAAALWIEYNVAAWATDPNRLVVEYEAFLDRLNRTVDYLVESLNFPTPNDHTRTRIAQFIDAGLQHHTMRKTERTGPLMGEAISLHSLMTREPATADLMVRMRLSNRELIRASADSNGRLESISRNLAEAESSNERLRKRLDSAQQELMKQAAQLTAATSCLAKQTSIVESLKQKQTTLEEQVETLASVVPRRRMKRLDHGSKRIDDS